MNLQSNLKIFSVRYKKFSFFNPKFSFFNPVNLKLVNHFVSFKLFKFSKKFKSKKYILRKNIFKPFKFKEKFKPRYLKYKKFAVRKINKLKKRKFFKNFYFLLNNYSNRKLLNFGVKYRFNYHYNFSYNYLKYYLLCLKYFYKLNYRQNKIKWQKYYIPNFNKSVKIFTNYPKILKTNILKLKVKSYFNNSSKDFFFNNFKNVKMLNFIQHGYYSKVIKNISKKQVKKKN